jgi:hypothetical protein
MQAPLLECTTCNNSTASCEVVTMCTRTHKVKMKIEMKMKIEAACVAAMSMCVAHMCMYVCK